MQTKVRQKDNISSTSHTVSDLLASIKPRQNLGIPRMRLTVSRTDLLQDAIVLFKSGQYHHDREMTVRFEGEQAVDGGGKRRNFSLLLKTMASPTAKVRLFVSSKGRYLPVHNKDSLAGSLFKVCGQ